MSVLTEFENWRDEIYCGSRFDQPEEWREAEIGAKYEMYDAVNCKVEKVVICTEKNKNEIEMSLNNKENDLWWYRKVKRIGINRKEIYV